VKYELAEKPNDIICRRVPIAFLDKKAALDLLPEVIEIMAKEKKWSDERIK
jgi:glycerol-3-phosphate dehydrogenase